MAMDKDKKLATLASAAGIINSLEVYRPLSQHENATVEEIWEFIGIIKQEEK